MLHAELGGMSSSRFMRVGETVVLALGGLLANVRDVVLENQGLWANISLKNVGEQRLLECMVHNFSCGDNDVGEDTPP